MPTAAERTGNLSGLVNPLGQPVTIFNPSTGLPFPGNAVPVSPQAQALLQLYPLPNIAGNSLYNYQAPVLNSSHQDALQSRLDKTLGRKDQLYGGFNFQSTRADNVNLFGFVDTTDTLGINANIQLDASLQPASVSLHWSYTFSRCAPSHAQLRRTARISQAMPASAATIRTPTNWGPPALSFSSGIAALTDGNSAFNRNRTDAFPVPCHLSRAPQHLTIGGDFRKQEFNDFFQQNPRGAFTFTGAATQSAANSVATAAAPISPTSSSAFRTPAPSPLATRTNICANRSTTLTSPMTGVSCPSSPSMPACAGSTARRSPSCTDAW